MTTPLPQEPQALPPSLQVMYRDFEDHAAWDVIDLPNPGDFKDGQVFTLRPEAAPAPLLPRSVELRLSMEATLSTVDCEEGETDVFIDSPITGRVVDLRLVSPEAEEIAFRINSFNTPAISNLGGTDGG